MSATPAEIASTALEAAANAAWRQWGVLGAPVSAGGAEPEAVIDPEALILLSLALRGHERRLDDVLGWWADAGAPLTSVQRVTTLGRRFPASAREGLGAFARSALESGDKRWSRHAREAAALATRGKRGREPRLTRGPALVLRLRAAFGVGLKADALAVLIALGGTSLTAPALSRTAGYNVAGVRRALLEMAAARVIETAGSARPAGYRADVRGWSGLLGLDSAPGPAGTVRVRWRHFDQVFAFLAAVPAWAGDASSVSPYVAASRARDLFEAHRDAFALNRIEVPDPSGFPGPLYLEAFAAAVDILSRWLGENL